MNLIVPCKKRKPPSFLKLWVWLIIKHVVDHLKKLVIKHVLVCPFCPICLSICLSIRLSISVWQEVRMTMTLFSLDFCSVTFSCSSLTMTNIDLATTDFGNNGKKWSVPWLPLNRRFTVYGNPGPVGNIGARSVMSLEARVPECNGARAPQGP